MKHSLVTVSRALSPAMRALLAVWLVALVLILGFAPGTVKGVFAGISPFALIMILTWLDDRRRKQA